MYRYDNLWTYCEKKKMMKILFNLDEIRINNESIAKIKNLIRNLNLFLDNKYR